MKLAQLIPFLLQLSIILTVLSYGLATRRNDGLYLVRHPSRLAASILAMHVVTPLVAVAFALALKLPPAVELALVTLAVSPISPLIPGKGLRSGGSAPYATALFLVTALLSVATVPITIALLSLGSSAIARVPPGVVAHAVFVTVLAPLLGGMLVRVMSPELALRVAGPLSSAARVLLLAALLPLLVRVMPAVLALLGNGTLLAVVCFALLALATGHMLGGAEWGDRIVLALSNCTRHPSVAIAVAASIAPAQREAAAAVILYLLVSAIMGSLYVRWTKSARTASDSAAPFVGEWSPISHERGRRHGHL